MIIGGGSGRKYRIAHSERLRRVRYGLIAPGLGIPLHDRGAPFDLEPGKANTVTPYCGFMEKGDVKIGCAIMGRFNQAQAHASSFRTRSTSISIFKPHWKRLDS
jgi:hypothetical protein